MDQNDLENLREYGFLEIAFLDITSPPLKLSGRLQLMWLRLLLIFRDISERSIMHKEEPSCRARVNHVRKIARIFKLDCFPEILSQLEICPFCDQPTVLLVHDDMICDGCWLKFAAILQQAYRDLKEGKSPDEVERLFNERIEEFASRFSAKPQHTFNQ
jgi:hypothetical protein